MENKRVLFIVNSLGGGGAERVCINLSNSFCRKGYAVDIISLKPLDDVRYNVGKGVNLYSLNYKLDSKISKMRCLFVGGRRLSKLIRKINPGQDYALITSHLPMSNIATRFSTVGEDSIYVFHSTIKTFSETKSRIFKALLRKFFKNRKIACVSEGIRKECRDEYGLQDKFLRTIYNPILKTEIRRKANVDDGETQELKPYLLFVGRLNKLKRPDRALAVLSESNLSKKYNLVFCGAGELEDELLTQARELGLEKKIVFLGWQDNVYKWIKNAEVLLCTSDHEGFPMGLVEALACGTKVVSSNCEFGPNEILTGEYADFLVEKDDLAGYVKAIKKAVKSYPKTVPSIISECSPEKIVDEYLDYYDNNNRKVGLLSIHSAHNYGSVLQAFALQETLKRYSPNIEMINYRPGYFEKMYKIFSPKIYHDYPGFINKLLHLGWRTVMIRRRIKKAKKFEKFISANMNLTRPFKTHESLRLLKNAYDTVVVGSDQVWNTDITEGFDGAYFLDFVSDDTRRVSYAASIARETISPAHGMDYRNALAKFSAVSVREGYTRDTLRGLLKREVAVSIDPTFLLDRNVWENFAEKSDLNAGNSEYIFVYALQDNPELVKIVNSLSEKLGLKVISISKKRRFKNETIYPDAGPEDFLALIKNAKFVVTNSFHGAAFSIIFEKQNCIVPHLRIGGRMVDLLGKLNLQERVMTKYEDEKLAELVKDDLNYQDINKIIERERKKADEYLARALRDLARP